MPAPILPRAQESIAAARFSNAAGRIGGEEGGWIRSKRRVSYPRRKSATLRAPTELTAAGLLARGNSARIESATREPRRGHRGSGDSAITRRGPHLYYGGWN